MFSSLLFAILMIVIGFLLVLIEVFLIPGINLFGIVGVLAVIGGIVYSYMLNPAYAIYTILGSVFISAVLVKWVTHSGAWDKLIHRDSEDQLEGYRGSKENLEFLRGKTGYALTSLHPAGTALINENRVDVVSEGIYIEEGTPLRVIKVQGNRVVVRPIEQEKLES